MSLRRQTLWSMMPILVTSIVSVVTVPIYFRVLGEETYALWIFIATLTGAFGFMDLGMGVATGRFMGVALGQNDHVAVKEYWATGNAIVLPMVVLFALVFIALGISYGPVWFSPPVGQIVVMKWAILWGGISLFFSYYGQMWHQLAQTYLDFKYLSILRTACTLATSLGTVAVALLTRNVAAILFFGLLIGLVQFGLLWQRGIQHYKLPFHAKHFRKSRLREMLPYTAKTFGTLISGSFLGSLDRIVLARLAPAADFAAFGVANNIGGRISGLSVAIMGPIFHNTTRGVGGDASRKPVEIYRESFDLMFPWYSLAIVGVFFWSGPMTELWLGEKYGTMVGQAFPWVVAGLCLNAVANISGAQMGGLNRVGTLLILQVVVGIASIALVYIGWQVDGLQGAAVGFFSSRAIWIVQDYLVRRWIGISPREVLNPIVLTIFQVFGVGIIYYVGKVLEVENLFISFGLAIVSGIAGAFLNLIYAKHRVAH